MTVATTSLLAGPFTGSGSSAAIPFTFKCFNATDLVVARDGVALTYGGDYSVTLNADQSASPGGTINITAAANTTGSVIYVTLSMTPGQPTSLPSQSSWSPKVVELALDRLALLIKQLFLSVSRAALVPLGESIGLLPAKSLRAGNFLVFDANGDPAVTPSTSGADTALRTDLAASTGAALVGWITNLAGGIARTIRDKLRERVSVLDFGGVIGGDPTTNAAALAAALATGNVVRIPGTGTFSVTSLSVADGQALISDPGITIHCTGTTSPTFSGNNVTVKIRGEINAPNAPNSVRVFNFQYADLKIQRIGVCTTACLFHDASAQTLDEGNNRIVVNNIQAAGVPYGVDWASHATFTCEGSTTDIIVIYSATTCGIRIGSGHDTLRFMEWIVSVDAQGITPMLIDVYDDKQGIRLRNWGGQVSPPVAHVRFNAGVNGCHMEVLPGVQDTLLVSDLGSNTWEIAGGNGIRLIGGIRSFLGKFGYASGYNIGGATTQLVDKSTSVTLNTLCGQITTTAASLAANTGIYFGLVNNKIGVDDELALWLKSGAADPTAYTIRPSGNGGGSRSIGIRNHTSGALAETLVIGFAVRAAAIS